MSATLRNQAAIRLPRCIALERGAQSSAQRILPIPREPLELSFGRPELVECVSIVQPTVLHDVSDRIRVLDLDQRILVEYQEVRKLTNLERPDVLPQSD